MNSTANCYKSITDSAIYLVGLLTFLQNFSQLKESHISLKTFAPYTSEKLHGAGILCVVYSPLPFHTQTYRPIFAFKSCGLTQRRSLLPHTSWEWGENKKDTKSYLYIQRGENSFCHICRSHYNRDLSLCCLDLPLAT